MRIESTHCWNVIVVFEKFVHFHESKSKWNASTNKQRVLYSNLSKINHLPSGLSGTAFMWKLICKLCIISYRWLFSNGILYYKTFLIGKLVYMIVGWFRINIFIILVCQTTSMNSPRYYFRNINHDDLFTRIQHCYWISKFQLVTILQKGNYLAVCLGFFIRQHFLLYSIPIQFLTFL